MTLEHLSSVAESFAATPRMPLMFVGHGSPMNAIEDNEFSKKWIEIGRALPKPNAILSVSAHWITQNATLVTAMDVPKTIHDFGGFPDELFAVSYPAPGSARYAKETSEAIVAPKVGLDYSWGLDHGTWSVLLRMFPKADVPVYQLSIDYRQPAQFHYDLGKQLLALRHKGVLIMGSGNLVHNLREIGFGDAPYDWAVEFDSVMARHLNEGDHTSIIHYQSLGALTRRAHPTVDHFLPLLYVIGAHDKQDQLEYFNAGITAGSISMRSVMYR